MDFFSFVGLPRKLNLDAADLEQRYRSLSRQYHPDYFYNSPPAERRASVERSSYLNDAYRTLRNPVARAEYLLGLEGFAASTPEAAGQIPAALLEEVFALNEQLDEVRGLRASGAPRDQLTQRLDRARERIEQKRADHERHVEQLCAQWDAFVDGRAGQESRREILEALRDRMLERNYINNLLAAIERELLADA